MKRISLILLSALCLLSGCAGESPIGGAEGPTSVYVEESKTYDWGLTLSAENVTAGGIKIRVTQKGGKPTGQLQTGADFVLFEKKGEDWEPVSTIIENYTWNAMAYIIRKNETTEFSVDWEYLYGKLSPGEYCLKKEFMDFRAAGDYDVEEYSTLFVVAEEK